MLIIKRFISISIDIPYMRHIKIKNGNFELKEKVLQVYEKTITRFGNSAKVDAQKKFIGKRAYVIIIDD
jgi:putative transposon-encoded protein